MTDEEEAREDLVATWPRRYQIETQHGVYPPGTWGFRGARGDLRQAIADCWPDERVRDLATGEVYWPTSRQRNA